ncbi:type I 3-dehydroquinate dehydratase [Brachybacterium sp. GCM10030267]|uniref:type I 3-dehydroquinate dehydratase n=1 Tax=unclassified Brachybacterium TaxID=2623841 RepID=UPI00361C0396
MTRSGDSGSPAADGPAAGGPAADAGVVRVRGIELGRGRPEIIVPVTGADQGAVLDQARAATDSPGRVLEWRLDRFRPDLDVAAHRDAAVAALPALREIMGQDRALLVTLRTSAEGGSREISDDELAATLEAVMAGGFADLVDVETSRSPETGASVIASAHALGLAVVGSFHDFERTPPEDEMAEILRTQRRLGADLPKIAVTPRDARDVLALLAASVQVADDGLGPHIAISMGSLGAVSRVAAETFAGAATFAAVGEGSAPGQLEAGEVARMLTLLRP